MPPPAIPPAPRKTLREWIDLDDDPTSSTRPKCSDDLAALHARIPLDAAAGRETPEPIQPPAGLHLAPLG